MLATGAGALSGGLAYLGWNPDPSTNYAPQWNLLSLSKNTSTPLVNFTSDSYESEWIQISTYDSTSNSLLMMLQYQGNDTQGLVAEYSLKTPRGLKVIINTTFCWFFDVDEKDPNVLLCLTSEFSLNQRIGCAMFTCAHLKQRTTALPLIARLSAVLKNLCTAVPPSFDYEASRKLQRQRMGVTDSSAAPSMRRYPRPAAALDGASRQLQGSDVPAYFLRLNRTDGSVISAVTFATGITPCNEAHAYDRSANVIYAEMAPEDASTVYIVGLDASSGAVVSKANVGFGTLYFAFAWDAVSKQSYGVVYNLGMGTVLAQIDLSTGRYTQISKASFPAVLQQFNAITTVAGAIKTYFFTAFSYPKPTVPQLWVIGVDLGSGDITYQLPVDNPFIDIVWLNNANANEVGGAE